MTNPQNKIHGFFHALDERDTEGLLATMTEDAVWIRQGKRHVGLTEIAGALAGRSATLYVRHLVTNLFPLTGRELARSDDKLRTLGIVGHEGLHEETADTQVFSSYLSGYTYDDGTLQSEPCEGGHLHKLSWVRTTLKQDRGGWRIAEQIMLPLFIFHGV